MSDINETMNNENILDLPVSDLKPFPNNPRKISDEAVNAVARSIKEYGWQQPIVTDENHVIIVGHTRLKAAQSLGYETVPVLVSGMSPEQAKEYRLVDNRVGEFSQWDEETLAMEAREFPDELVEEFFPELDLEIESIEAANISNDDVEKAAHSIGQVTPTNQINEHTVDVECPSCGETFEVRTMSLPGASEDLVKEVMSDG